MNAVVDSHHVRMLFAFSSHRLTSGNDVKSVKVHHRPPLRGNETDLQAINPPLRRKQQKIPCQILRLPVSYFFLICGIYRKPPQQHLFRQNPKKIHSALLFVLRKVV
jgi:hypothetical protein